ncbi:MAG: fimbrillin family protein [Bacteroidales bacterium]|nr:fimbrillin family protein [Bacteroidales bacterium]
MKRVLFTLAIAAAALCACNKAEQTTPTGPKPVVFTYANLGTYMFKSPTLAIGEDGCGKVGIYAADLGANNVTATVGAGTLTPDATIYWGIGQADDEATTFVARYPHANDGTIDGEYAIPDNQSSEDTFSYQENLMSAVKSATPEPGTVAFNFTHPFAKVVVNVTNNLGADAVSSVVLEKVIQKATKLDMTKEPAAVTLSEEAEDVKNVTAYKSGDAEYSMIIMPQPAVAGMNIVVTTTLGSVYQFKITNQDYVFHAGKKATANVILDPIEGSNLVRTSVGAMTFATVDWTDDVATTIDAAADPTLGSGYFQIGGTIFTDDDKDNGGDPTVEAWGKWYNMTLTAENTWQAVVNYKEAMANKDENKGFLIKIGETYYKMWDGSDNIGDEQADNENGYGLSVADGTHNKNVRLGTATGKFVITFNSSTKKVSYVTAQ